jgi:membrane protease YdiL (CAAX protease family)
VLPAVLVPLGCGYRARDALLLARRPPARAVGLGLAIGLGAFFAAGALMSLTSLALPARWVEGFDLPRKILELPPRERLGVWVAAATAAPLFEELCFRGWVLTALRTRRGTAASLALSGLLFAVVHLDPVRFVAVFALGTLYAWLAWRSGSLWPAVAAHVANNALGAALAATAGESDLAAARAQGLQAAASSALVLVLAAAVVRGLAVLYRRATPAPPPVEAALVPRDPASPPSRFSWPRVPRAWRVAFLGGVALLWLMAGSAATRRGGTRGASGSAPPGTAGSPGDPAAGAAPPRAADRPAP